MNIQNSELQEKVRQQFETGPYPRIPLEVSLKENYNFLFIHNLVTPYYLKHKKITDSKGKLILDAGCGSGYKALALAEANPGAKIVGIDLSQESVNLARERLQYYGFDNAEFYVMPLEDLPQLGMKFDYINNDEVLYLLSNPVIGLQAMKSVLNPEGIIRSNLHSSIARDSYFRAQKVFKMMGLMDDNPGELEVSIVRETFKALKDGVSLKKETWKAEQEDDSQYYMMNYLFQGDKGYTISQMFAALKDAGLEILSMVNWRRWALSELFQNPEDLPTFLAMSLPGLSLEEQLHLFELLHPIHRLLDFWCTHPGPEQSVATILDWTDSDWQSAWVHLHPQLRNPTLQADLLQSISNRRPFGISKYVTTTSLSPMYVESSLAACLLPLWEKEQPVSSLVERWIQIRPLDPATLEPVSHQTAFEEIKHLLSDLEVFLYVLLERST